MLLCSEDYSAFFADYFSLKKQKGMIRRKLASEREHTYDCRFKEEIWGFQIMNRKNLNRLARLVIIGIILCIALTFVKLPFYITQPGGATELQPLIQVEGGDKEAGSFSLMTVQVGPANPLTFLWAKIRPYHEIMPEANFKQEGETDDEYMKRQLQMMNSSQQSAIIAAYEKAGKDVKTTFNGVFASQIVSGMPAAGKIEVGDKIISIDGKSFTSSEELIRYVGNKKNGDTIKLTVERDNKKREIEMKLQAFKEDPKRVGMGVGLMTDQKVEVNPEINVKIEHIGGPSAGLMMTLEIYNQLTEGDETKGYHIAGTGTMDPKGNVGAIGGIKQKVVGADDAGNEIFFAPVDGGNYDDALVAAKDIKTKMKIVPVKTLDDALNYLNKLKPKST